MMRTGEVEANLRRLNELFKLKYLDELISRKSEGTEKANLVDGNMDFYEAEYLRLRNELEETSQSSHLPETASAKDVLNDLLIRVRLNLASVTAG
jgi:hypothetical protein